MRKPARILTGIFLGGLVLSLSAFSQEGTSSDSILTESVMKRIHAYVSYGLNDYVTAEVTDGKVTLRGWVHLYQMVDKVGRLVGKVDGVKNVENFIQPTYGSDELANKAVQTIYRDEMFYKYRYQVDPPVHIIRINNKLILAGNVQSDVQRRHAEYLVGFNTNAYIENQLNVISE
jgi:osmotically-inducible protein OsmY